MPKINWDKFVEWFRQFPHRYKVKRRLGEAFLKKFFPKTEDNTLLYEEDDTRAYQRICNKYIQ